ncbi:MAG: SBBP repeat-containing protein [Nostoc sp. NMS1]|uniref:SBBP repeat-containing protein n=1 Tax=unclassified Nostoc TaxID=2593658 RepID=UPI0025F95D65|nr:MULTISPECIES: SBBP repeat-containing protein [unclassified Nostoc]MBN3907026.1 SBBP repeat-containing protein [Nostoc sp. NMS1]MBN3992070.1 SBBP repeat-containing protein [Nostoc sp. NMS2]
MANSKATASLYTPGSDVVFPGNVNLEAIFGRAGNDLIYSYDPGVDNTTNQNIDFLFGDIFENSAEEFEIILNIQQGNPLLILDRNIPSVGSDKFILGDKNQPYYTNNGDPDNLLTTDFLGLNQYAVIYDFAPSQDTIRLNGKPQDYRLVDVNGLKVEGIDHLFYGKAIFSVQKGLPDLVTFVIEKPEVHLDLNGKYFEFVGEKPQTKPAKRKIGQLGTTALDVGTGAATDSSGNLYIAGFTGGALQGTNKGSTDAWVTKYDKKGNPLWGKQIGTSNSDQVYSVVTDKDGNFYLAGTTGGNLFSSKQSDGTDVWVAKYDSNGNQLWGKQFGTNVAGGFASASFGLDVDQVGNVYLSGLSIKENTNLNIFNFSVQDDSWVTKFDSNGNQQWFTQVKDPTASFPFNLTPFFDECYDLAVDKNGNSYATGWTQGLVKESDPSKPGLKYDAWLTKVDPNGQVQWVQQFGSKNEGLDFAWADATDSKGNIYVTGWTTGDLGTKDKKGSEIGSYDVWLTKFNPNGTLLWAKQFGAKGDDGAYLSDLEIDSQDNIFLTGYSNDKLGKGTKDTAYNAFVAKFDTDGTNKWIQQFGSKSRLDYATGLTADDSGKLFVTGVTDGLLGSGTNEANGSALDAWVAELNANNGKLRKFTGTSQDVTSITDPGPISTIDITNNFVTDDKLSNGDNRIDPAQGIDTKVKTFNYGQFTSNLGNIFDPGEQNSFASVLSKGVTSGNAPFLNNSDLNLLQG